MPSLLESPFSVDDRQWERTRRTAAGWLDPGYCRIAQSARNRNSAAYYYGKGQLRQERAGLG